MTAGSNRPLEWIDDEQRCRGLPNVAQRLAVPPEFVQSTNQSIGIPRQFHSTGIRQVLSLPAHRKADDHRAERSENGENDRKDHDDDGKWIPTSPASSAASTTS